MIPPQSLSSDQSHDPSGDKHSADEHGEAVEPVLYLLHHRIALGDSEDNRGEECKHYRGREVRQADGHGFFPSAM